jgi:probable phosphoglycerate mutase
MKTPEATLALLIRHGHTDAIGRRLVGRLPGVHLSSAGRTQADDLPLRVAGERLAAVYSSPRERAIETAGPLAKFHGLDVQVRKDLDEVDFGAWTGMTFTELAALEAWRVFNSSRAAAVVPDGESAPAVQVRIMAALGAIRSRHPGETVALVSHADVIRPAVLKCTGISLNLFGSVEIDPASVSAIALDATGPHLLYVNETNLCRYGPKAVEHHHAERFGWCVACNESR